MRHVKKAVAYAVVWIALVPATPLPVNAQVKLCTDLRDEIAQKVRARGPGAFQLHILERSEKTHLKIVGTCDGGRGKIAFQSGDGPPQVGATRPAEPRTPKEAAVHEPAAAPAPAAPVPAQARAPSPVIPGPTTSTVSTPPVGAEAAPPPTSGATASPTAAGRPPSNASSVPVPPAVAGVAAAAAAAVAPRADAAAVTAPAAAAAPTGPVAAAPPNSGAPASVAAAPKPAPPVVTTAAVAPPAPGAEPREGKAPPKVLGMVESREVGSAARPITAPEGLWAAGEARQCHAAYPATWQAEKLEGEQAGKAAARAGESLELPYRLDIHPSFDDPLALSHFHYVFGIRQPWRYELRPMALARRDWPEASRLNTLPRDQLRTEELELKDDGLLDEAVSREEWDRARQLAKGPAVDIVWYELSSLAKVANQMTAAPKPVGEFSIRTMMKYPETAGVEDQRVQVWDDGNDWVVGFSLSPNQVFNRKDKRGERPVYEYRCWASKKLDREKFVQTCGSLIERSTRSPDFPIKACVSGGEKRLAYAKGR